MWDRRATPRPGTTLRWGHPLSRGLVFCAPMRTGDDPTRDLARSRRGTITLGATAPRLTGGNTLLGPGSTGLDFGSAADGRTVTYANDAAFDRPTDAVTVAALVKAASGAGTGWGLYMGKPAGATHVSPWYDWSLYQAANGSGGAFGMRVELGAAESPASAYVRGVPVLLTGAWSKDLDSGNPALYVNGVVLSSYASQAAKTSAIGASTQSPRMGTAVDGTSDDFDGVVYAVWVWSRRLTAAEILTHAKAPFAMVAPPILASIRRANPWSREGPPAASVWTAGAAPTGTWTQATLPTSTAPQVMLLLALCSAGSDLSWTKAAAPTGAWSVDSLP